MQRALIKSAVAISLACSAASACAVTGTAAGSTTTVVAAKCPATARIPALPITQRAPEQQPIVRPSPVVATICQYAPNLPSSKSSGAPLHRIVLRGLGAAGLATVLDNGGPLTNRAARCDRSAGRFPLFQIVRFGYRNGDQTAVTVAYTNCSLAVVTSGRDARVLTGQIQDDLFFYTSATRADQGPRTPGLIGSAAIQAAKLAQGQHFTFGVDGEAIDSAAGFGIVIFQTLPAGIRNPSGAPTYSVGGFVAVHQAPACRSRQLRADYRGGGASAGSDFAGIIFRNVAGTPCTLAGRLRLIGLGANGRPDTNPVFASVAAPGVLSPHGKAIPDRASTPVGELVYLWQLAAEYRDDASAPNGLCTPHWVTPAAWRIELPGGAVLTVPNVDRHNSLLTPAGGLVTCRGRLGAIGQVSFWG